MTVDHRIVLVSIRVQGDGWRSRLPRRRSIDGRGQPGQLSGLGGRAARL